MISSVPDLAELPLPPDTVGLLEGLTDHAHDPSLHRRTGPARGAARHVVRRDACAERLEPPAVPLPRAHRRAVRPGGEGAASREARARPGARSASRDGYDAGSGTVDDSPKARIARTMQRYVDEFANVPVLVLPCLVRYRAPDVLSKARRSTPRARTCCSRRAPSGTAAVLTDLAHDRRGRAARAARTSPTTCSSPPPSRSDGPTGRTARCAAGRSPKLIFEDRWDEPARVGRRPARHAVHRGRTPGTREAVPRKAAAMTWDFSTEPEFQEKLDWIDEFVRTEIEPIDLAFSSHTSSTTSRTRCTARSSGRCRSRCKTQDLWACHLGPDLGGLGYGQVKLALMNEILGRSIVGADRCSAARRPTPGNAEILAHYGTAGAEGRSTSSRCSTARSCRCFSMTEPQGGSDPRRVHVPRRARRRRVGHQRREVVLVEPALRGVRDRDGRHRPRRVDLPGRVDVPRADRHAGHRTSSATSASAASRSARDRTRTCATTTCACPTENVLGGAGPGVRDRADAARWRSHPPRDAHRRHVPEGAST